MPAPTNISFVTAIELGPLPNSITQNVNDSGTTYTVYYKYTTAVDGVFEFFAFGDLIAYTVSLFIYEDSDLVNPYLGFGFDDVRNAAVVVPMSAGHVYYFKCVSYGGNVSPAVLIIDGDDTPDGDLSSGNLFIQDDADGYPGTATYLTTGSVIKYINPFPAGEIGTAIPGFVAVIDDTDDLVKIYSVDTTGFTFVTSVNPFPGEDLATQGKGAIGSNHTDKFYVGCANVGGGAGHTQVKSISTAGVVLQTWTLPGTLLYVMDVAQDSGILYYSENAIATAIKRYDLVNDIALANLYAGLALHTTSDIKTLSDGTILVCFVRAGNTEVIHFSAAGATLNTYPFGNANSGFEARMDVYIDDPISFIIWIHALPNNRFDRIQISDGTTISSIEVPIFENGISFEDPTAVPTRTGASQSCPFIVLTGITSETPTTAGLYVSVDPRWNHTSPSGGNPGTPNAPQTNDELFAGDSTTIETEIPEPSATIYPAGD